MHTLQPSYKYTCCTVIIIINLNSVDYGFVNVI